VAKQRAQLGEENPTSRKATGNGENIISSFLHFRRGKDVWETNQGDMGGRALLLGTEFSVQGGSRGKAGS